MGADYGKLSKCLTKGQPMKKTLSALVLTVLCAPALAADAPVDAVAAANLVRQPVVRQCIEDVEKSVGLGSTISSLRPSSAGYMITLAFRGGDVALSPVELAVTAGTVAQPWGPVTTYTCEIIHTVIHF